MNQSSDEYDVIIAGQGAIAATSAYEYASEHPNACELHAIGYEVA